MDHLVQKLLVVEFKPIHKKFIVHLPGHFLSKQKLQYLAKSNLKRAKSNLSRSDNLHALSRSEHNLRFTEKTSKQITLDCQY